MFSILIAGDDNDDGWKAKKFFRCFFVLVIAPSYFVKSKMWQKKETGCYLRFFVMRKLRRHSQLLVCSALLLCLYIMSFLCCWKCNFFWRILGSVGRCVFLCRVLYRKCKRDERWEWKRDGEKGIFGSCVWELLTGIINSFLYPVLH